MTIIAHYSTWNQCVKNKKKEEGVQEESRKEKEKETTSEKVIRFSLVTKDLQTKVLKNTWYAKKNREK